MLSSLRDIYLGSLNESSRLTPLISFEACTVL